MYEALERGRLSPPNGTVLRALAGPCYITPSGSRRLHQAELLSIESRYYAVSRLSAKTADVALCRSLYSSKRGCIPLLPSLHTLYVHRAVLDY